MAVQKIAMGINLRQNKIEGSSAYGKYYPEVDQQKTVTTLKPIATAVAEWKAENGGTTGGDNNGGDNTGGNSSGGSEPPAGGDDNVIPGEG